MSSWPSFLYLCWGEMEKKIPWNPRRSYFCEWEPTLLFSSSSCKSNSGEALGVWRGSVTSHFLALVSPFGVSVSWILCFGKQDKVIGDFHSLLCAVLIRFSLLLGMRDRKIFCFLMVFNLSDSCHLVVRWLLAL